MALEEVTYEEYMKKIDELEKRYLSDEKGFPPGAKEKGLEICAKFRREVAEGGPENFESSRKRRNNIKPYVRDLLRRLCPEL